MLWRRAVDRAAPDQFRSFTVALSIELLKGPHAPASPIGLGYRTGTRELAEPLKAMRDEGVHHLMLNLLPTRTQPYENLAALTLLILPSSK